MREIFHFITQRKPDMIANVIIMVKSSHPSTIKLAPLSFACHFPTSVNWFSRYRIRRGL